MKKRIISLVILVTLFGTVAYAYFQSRPEGDKDPKLGGKDYQLEISTIEKELSTVLKTTKGIHPDTYRQIDDKLILFERSGADTNKARALLSQFDIGGSKTPVRTAATIEVRAAAQPLSLVQPQPQTQPQTQTQVPVQSDESKYRTSPAGWFPPSTCSGTAVKFTSSPVNTSDISHIVPMGKMAAGHVTPTDHGYFINRGEVSELRSPADGYIQVIGTFPQPNDYRVVLWHSCTVSTIFIHLKEIAPEILAQTGDIPPGSSWEADQGPNNNRIKPIPIKAGQVIGKIKGGVDFSVHDTSVFLSGFVTPSIYYDEPWKIHTADFFSYFAEPLQSELKKKSLRTSAPVAGKIDYDVDGRLIGNWFVAGTDYKNSNTSDYYKTHLAIAYDHVTPNLVRISIPNSGIDDNTLCKTCFGSYGVRGNAPDPANVGVNQGLIKYELVATDHVEDPRFPGLREITKNVDSQTLGVFLVQMEGSRRIKTEIFPGKTAAQVTGFTAGAKVYAR